MIMPDHQMAAWHLDSYVMPHMNELGRFGAGKPAASGL